MTIINITTWSSYKGLYNNFSQSGTRVFWLIWHVYTLVYTGCSRHVQSCCSIHLYTIYLRRAIKSTSQFLYMSQSTFSMGVFPMVFWKKTASILEAGTIRNRGNISSNLPNLATWPGSWVRQCCHSITWAWSWRFSIWLGSFRPLVSRTIELVEPRRGARRMM